MLYVIYLKKTQPKQTNKTQAKTPPQIQAKNPNTQKKPQTQEKVKE